MRGPPFHAGFASFKFGLLAAASSPVLRRSSEPTAFPKMLASLISTPEELKPLLVHSEASSQPVFVVYYASVRPIRTEVTGFAGPHTGLWLARPAAA